MYSIVFDNGMPSEIECKDLQQVKEELTTLKDKFFCEDIPYFDVWVYEGDKDITETQMIQEMVRDIVEGMKEEICDDVVDYGVHKIN